MRLRFACGLFLIGVPGAAGCEGVGLKIHGQKTAVALKGDFPSQSASDGAVASFIFLASVFPSHCGIPIAMFTSLHLKQFKSWTDTGPVTLAPVTLVLGANSSGKSSLIQSLLLLKQTVESSDRTIHLNLGGDPSTDLFNFGDFESIHKQGATDDRFSISFSFKGISTRQRKERVNGGHFSACYRQTPAGATVIQELLLKDSEGSHGFRIERQEKGAFSIFMDPDKKPLGKSKDYAPERSIAFSRPAISLLEDNGNLAEDVSLAIDRKLRALTYLGPLRRQPERDYLWNKAQPGEIGIDGRRAIDALLASAFPDKPNSPGHNRILNGVSKWLRKMNLAEQLEVCQVGRSNRYEVVVSSHGISTNLRDVGIGVSQVLPVLTVAFFAPPGSTVVLEEPEIHFHPLAQSLLAELFTEVSRERRIQFIVETHSEHLFRRMQTLIARRTIEPEHCAMYFVERDQEGSHLRELALDDYGRVKNWPDQFFGDALGETAEQARLMFERRMEEG